MSTPEPAAPTDVLDTGVTADAVDLFLFSAAVGLAHRIHYDVEFARAEGLPGLPVHGPLQGAWLSQQVSRWAREHGGRIETLTLRHRRPVLAGQKATVRASATAAEPTADGVRTTWTLEVLVEGEARTTGTATTVVPAGGAPA